MRSQGVDRLPDMKRALLLGMVLLMTLPAAASAKLLAQSVAQGQYPFAHVDLDTEQLTGPVQMEVRSNPRSTLVPEFQISCESGTSSSARAYFLRKQVGPINKRFALPIKNPDNCNVLADARFDTQDRGRIVLRILG